MSLILDRGRVWTLTLDRPERANALSAHLVESLLALLAEAEHARPTAVVLRGNPRHFAAGFDVAGLHDESDASLAVRFLRIGQLLERLATAPYLTVAVVEGSAVGAGADLVAACDHRLASPRATFRFPGARFGVVLGTARLAALSRSVGLAGGAPLTAEQTGGLVTGTPEDLPGLLRDWSTTEPCARPALLAAGRPPVDHDAALAALARSVARPGLRDRIAAYAGVASLPTAPRPLPEGENR
ncbi:enoyl-CoA hydratase/isomerase family protein [Nocardioides insulae]|uniref:enoyl-CoA hydratase/isomerase family protein n=1 Tax=Nocardioides insulae TaxID=394734 RepID=UPI00040FE5AC|nr:enoyl-CoA hydratase/isomerase family protein [Nocardioides insulae]